MENELIFWFDQPPKVGKGCFNYITTVWPGKVIYAYMHGYSQTRKKTHWDDGEFAKAIMINLSESPKQIADQLFYNYPNAIHIIDGFKSDVFKVVKKHVLAKKSNFICFSERPGVYGEWWKKTIKMLYIPLSEICIRIKYEKCVNAYLPLGMTGVKTNLKFGWHKDKLYPFMYDPVDYTVDKSVRSINSPIRFLYVGRFSRYTKGTDILVHAFDQVKRNENLFSLTMVGGYGDMKEEILSWINTKPFANFGGTWDSLEVGNKMKDYDVCIVPSKFDGWNLLVNEATRAHIGVLASDQAVSDEIVLASKSGIVYRANSARELADAIEYAIDNPDVVYKWKQNAKEFSHKISSESVGEYLVDIIKYECFGYGKRPNCPWINSCNT